MYKIKDIEKVKDKDGKKVFRFPLKAEQWIVLELKKGTIAGEHYHKGISPVKNPEVDIILKGKLKYTLKDIKTGKQEEVIVNAMQMIEILPNVYHVVEALEDSQFIEAFDEAQDRWEL